MQCNYLIECRNRVDEAAKMKRVASPPPLPQNETKFIVSDTNKHTHESIHQ